MQDLFCCHSRQISNQWNKLDYVGIVLMIVGGSFPIIYYCKFAMYILWLALYCHVTLQVFYIGLVLLFGIGTVCFL